MEDFIVAMLNMIGGGGAGSIATGMLSQGPETWNPALYQLAVNVHDVAVKPLTSVVLAVVFTLELARNSTRIESDRELGVKIVEPFLQVRPSLVVGDGLPILDGQLGRAHM